MKKNISNANIKTHTGPKPLVFDKSIIGSSENPLISDKSLNKKYSKLKLNS